MSYETTKGKPVRLKVTLTVEAESDKDLYEALNQGIVLAKTKPMHMSFGSKKPNGSHVSVRTTRVRTRTTELKGAPD